MSRCQISPDSQCIEPHYCHTHATCVIRQNANRFARTVMTGIDERRQRWENGPVCALCRHSTFQPADLPWWQLDPPSDEANMRAMKDTVRMEICPRIRRRITATSGKQCPEFEKRRT